MTNIESIEPKIENIATKVNLMEGTTTAIEDLYKLQIGWATVGFGDKIKEPQQVEVTWKMLWEEIKELKDAKSEVAILDACADIFVVASQLYNIYEEDKTPVRSDYAQASRCVSVEDYLECMRKVGILEDGKTKAVLASLYWAKLADYLEGCGFKVKEAIIEVTYSNWSKFPTKEALEEHYGKCETEEELLDKASKWIETNRKECNNVLGKFVEYGDTKVAVFRKDNGTGKIVKPSTYYDPNLEKLVKNNTKLK